MLEGMYSAAAGMAAQQERLDALSNDLANVSTTGYKPVRIAFRDLLYTPSGPGGTRGVQSGAGAAAVDLGRTDAQGSLQPSDGAFDVAIKGSGYLEVRDARGRVALTRDGALLRRPDGRLTTSTGELTGVTIPANVPDDRVVIQPNGSVHANGRLIGRLRLVDVRSPDQLASEGDNLLLPTAQSGRPVPVRGTAQLQQHALEESSVDMADTMSNLIDAQRAYELASKAISTQDQLLEIANQVKR